MENRETEKKRKINHVKEEEDEHCVCVCLHKMFTSGCEDSESESALCWSKQRAGVMERCSDLYSAARPNVALINEAYSKGRHRDKT